MAKVNLFELGKKLSQKGDLSRINSMLIIEPEDSAREWITNEYFDNSSEASEANASSFNLGIRYNVFSKQNSKQNTQETCQTYKLRRDQLTTELFKICLSSLKGGQVAMLIVADLARLDRLVENLVDLTGELERILNDFIQKKPNLIENSSYREMVARYEAENKIANFKPFPIPLMVIGCNFVKLELPDQDRQIMQQFLRHFCLIHFAQLYFLNEQSEYSVHRCKLLVNQLAFERNLKEALKLNQTDQSLLVLFGQDKLESIYANGRPLSWPEVLQAFSGRFAQRKSEFAGLEKEKIDVFAEPDIDYVYKFNLEKLEFRLSHSK